MNSANTSMTSVAIMVSRVSIAISLWATAGMLPARRGRNISEATIPYTVIPMVFATSMVAINRDELLTKKETMRGLRRPCLRAKAMRSLFEETKAISIPAASAQQIKLIMIMMAGFIADYVIRYPCLRQAGVIRSVLQITNNR